MSSQEFLYSSLMVFSQAAVDDEKCLEKVHLSDIDAYIFWIGGSLTLIFTFFLILGSLRFKELRKQPGDLILGVAISDLILSVHWIILASNRDMINDKTFCTMIGAMGSFGGISAFVYNSVFSLFLIVSLRNAIQQARIPHKLFHFISLSLTFGYLAYLYFANDIGKTLAGTCSIKSKCTLSFYNFFGSAVSILYAIFGTFTYLYVKKHMPICAQAHVKRTKFLTYYVWYNAICSISYFFVATTNILDTIMNDPSHYQPDHKDSDGQPYFYINSLYNLAKVTSPLILTLIRYNDPTIKRFMWKTILFRSKDSNKKLREALIDRDPSSGEGFEVENPLDMSSLSSNEFVFNQLSSNKRIEMTYTILACVMFADSRRKVSPHDPSQVRKTSDKSRKTPYKHEEVYLIEEEAIAQDLPQVKSEITALQYQILPGTLKVYADEIFTKLTSKDRSKINITESLCFSSNKEEVNLASSPMSGKSGEFFFFSTDKQLIIKTISDDELKMLINILAKYEDHFTQYPDSLIAKIFGVYTYENTDIGVKYNLLLMKNVCGYPSRFVERTYDMKGSTHDRQVLKTPGMVGKEALKNYVLKDADFEKYEKKLFITEELKQKVLEQIKFDVNFFQSVGIIDYSIMVFFVDQEKYKQEKGGENIEDDIDNPLASIKNENESNLIYRLGFIDYLQPYNLKKSFERMLKKIGRLNPNLDTSSQDPDNYAKRFIQYAGKLMN